MSADPTVIRRPRVINSPARAMAVSVRDTVSLHEPTMRASSVWVGTGASTHPSSSSAGRPCLLASCTKVRRRRDSTSQSARSLATASTSAIRRARVHINPRMLPGWRSTCRIAASWGMRASSEGNAVTAVDVAQSVPATSLHTSDAAQVQAWTTAALYLMNRIQTGVEKPGREPDMSPLAAMAVRSVGYEMVCGL